MGLGAPAAHAATDNWTNSLGNSFWDQLSNWSLGFLPTSTDAAVFPAPGPASKTVLLPNAGTMNALSLTFNESYMLSSGQLGLGSGGAITIASGKTATINSVLASTSGLTISGSSNGSGGTLVLNANNQTALTSGGDLRINIGSTVHISADANLGLLFKTWTNGTLEVDGTFNTTRRFEPGNGTIRVTSGNTLTLASNDQLGFSSTDTWTKEGDGTLKVTGSSSRFGTTFVNAGTLRLEGTMGYGQFKVGAATMEAAGISGFLSNIVTIGNGSVLRGIGTTMTASNVIGATGGDITPTLAAGTTTADVFTVQMPTFGGTIGSTITIAGPGTVKLTQNTNYPGAWNVSSGKLRVTAVNGLGNVSPTGPAVSVASGAALILDGIGSGRTINLASGSALQGTGATFTAATGTINVAPSSSTSLGTLASSDNLNIGFGLTGGSSATLLINSAGVVTLTGNSPFYSGSWWVAFGTLRLSNAGALGSGTSPIRISHVQGTLEGRSGITIARDITWENGTIAGTNGGASYTGTLTLGNAANVTLSGFTTLGDGPNDLTGGGGGAVIHIANSGTTTLTQSSDVLADWSLDSSTLSISDDAQLGAPANTITLNGNAGQLRMTAPINSTRNLVFNAGSIDCMQFDSTFADVSGGSGAVLKLGDGMLSVNRIRTNGTLSLAAGIVRLKADESNNATSVLKALAIVSPGRLDVADNKLIVHATPVGTWDGSAYSDVTGMIASGRNGGGWGGVSGIITSMTDAASGSRTTLGVASAANVKGTTTSLWGGQTVVPADTLVMYSYGGDANLDGKLNVDDYTRIDSSIGIGLTGWYNGDFNYDGKINIDDYTILDANILSQGPPIDAGVRYDRLSLTSVPEPISVGTVVGLTCLLGPLGRRRKP
jgi:autotransporter-associated beta strand protein